MFYLIQFFKVFIKSPIRGLFFLLLSMTLVFSLGQKKFLEEQVLKLIPENKAGSSFYALIANTESYQNVARQMQVLPGVYKVDTLSETQIKEEVKAVLGSLQVSSLSTSLDMNYAGIKVVYIKDLKPRAQELIRDYLTHLVAEGNITLGAIKDSGEAFDKRTQFIAGIKTWGYSGYLIVLLSFWFISLLSLRSKIEETSYILENYQRKKSVSMKMALNGMGLIFLLSVGSTFILGLPQLLNLLAALAVFTIGILLHMRKVDWENN